MIEDICQYQSTMRQCRNNKNTQKNEGIYPLDVALTSVKRLTANPADYDNGMLAVSQISLLPQKQSAQ